MSRFLWGFMIIAVVLELMDLLSLAYEQTEKGLMTDEDFRDFVFVNPARFVTLQTGRLGVGGIYDQWRRLKALARGETFDAAHGEAQR